MSAPTGRRRTGTRSPDGHPATQPCPVTALTFSASPQEAGSFPLIPVHTSSIHCQPIKVSSGQHNLRQKQLNHVDRRYSTENASWRTRSVPAAIRESQERYTRNDTLHRKPHPKAVFVREAVVVLEERHSLNALKSVGKALEREFGMKVFQVHLHRDEGKGEAVFREGPTGAVQVGKTIKPEARNFHGHILVKWVNQQGKTLRLQRHHMRKMRTVVAQELGMQRGKEGSKAVRLEALEYSEKKARERLAQVSKSLKRWTDKLGEAREEAHLWADRLLEKKKEWEAWISSTKKRLRGLRKGLKETPSSRIDRLKAVPAEMVIRRAEERKLAPAGQFVPAPSNKVQDSNRPDLKSKSTLDFLFKSCEMEFKDSLELLDQLRDQQQTKRQEQTKSKGQGVRRSLKIGM